MTLLQITGCFAKHTFLFRGTVKLLILRLLLAQSISNREQIGIFALLSTGCDFRLLQYQRYLLIFCQTIEKHEERQILRG